MQFTVPGIILLSVVFWSLSQSVTGEARKLYNMFLLVLLVSMLLLNWHQISPILFKPKGGQ